MIKFKFQNEKMEELGIAGIFLFGSHAQGIANKASDFDFAVLVKKAEDLYNLDKKNKIYNELYDILSGQIKRLCDIDIVFIEFADLQFRHHIVKDGILLYVGDKKIVSDFLGNTMEFYADFAPLRREFHKAILQKI
ncbi:MAG: nucleotidyltransferase domain-containing protein [Patescibacteria group bacterium]